MLLSIMVAIGFVVLAQVEHAQTAATDFIPFLSNSVTNRFDRSGVQKSVSHVMIARRRDGSKVRLYDSESPAGEMAQAGNIWDLRTRREVTLEPFTKSSMTFYLSDKRVEFYRKRESLECVDLAGTAEGSTKRMMGVDVIRIVDNSAGFKIDSWVAPSLGCLILQETAIHPSGSRNETVVTQLNLVHPPDALFDTPLDFTERPPQEMENLYRQEFGGKSCIRTRL